MAAPTLVQTSSNTWTATTGTSRVTSSISWQSGDIILCVGVTEDNGVTLNTPTATGLSFSAISGYPSNTASTCKMYAWVATPVASGSSGVTATINLASMANIQVFVLRGSSGIGATALSVSGSTTTISLTRTGTDSFVVFVGADYVATNDVSVTTVPSGGTQRQTVTSSGRATMFLINWANEGAAGTTSYGISAFTTAGVFSKSAIEVKGIASTANTAQFFAVL